MPSDSKQTPKENTKIPHPPWEDVRPKKAVKPAKTWDEAVEDVLRRDAALWERLAKL